jgi:Protein of unknown function (DUF2726)
MASIATNALSVIAAAVVLIVPFVFWRKYRAWPDKKSHDQVFKQPANRAAAATTNPSVTPQIQRILYASFDKKPLMNKEEYKLFIQLERLIGTNTNGMRLFSQVPLGEILRSNDSDAFFCINSKRCDFIIIDRFGKALVALEYHGSGHFQGNSSMRDEVKRLALKKASIPTIEVLLGYQWAEVEKDLRKAGVP